MTLPRSRNRNETRSSRVLNIINFQISFLSMIPINFDSRTQFIHFHVNVSVKSFSELTRLHDYDDCWKSCLRKRSALRKIVFWHQETSITTNYSKITCSTSYEELCTLFHDVTFQIVRNRDRIAVLLELVVILIFWKYQNDEYCSDEGSRIRWSLIVHNFFNCIK